MCGTAIARACLQCGEWNPLNFRFCGTCGSEIQIAMQQKSTKVDTRPLRQLEGERRLCTVLMADVFNSTGILERVGSESWVMAMNQVLQIMEREIKRLGGIVDQFRGDGLVAFFGSQQAHEDDPERGVMAALGIQDAITEYAKQVLNEQDIRLRVRVGVNTGELIRTSMSDDPQRQMDTGMGEAITVAARMETSAEPGTVLVSQNTYRLIESHFKWQPLGEIPIKGLSYPIRAYRPISHQSADEAAPQTEKGMPAEALFRPEEAEILIRQIKHLLNGQGGIALLSGKKGMGKTFLLRYVREHFNAEREHTKETSFTWLTGYCHSFEQNQPYSMWVDLLERWLNTVGDESAEKRRERLHKKLHEYESIGWTYPYLATMLSLPIEDEYNEWLGNIPVEELKKLIFRATRSWLKTLASIEPLLLAFAYVQWADETSLELLETCLPLCERLPILFQFTHHSDLDTVSEDFRNLLHQDYSKHLVFIELQPFDKDQSRALIETTLAPHKLSKGTLELVIQQAEGNPYYINELLHQMMENNIIQRDKDSGAWHETRTVTSLDLPNSLQGLLMTRLDRLSSHERQVIQTAAVIGNVFWRDILYELFEEVEMVNIALERLLSNQLIHIRAQVHELGIEYAFTSSLIRDLLYDSLLSSQRAQLHLQIANAIANCPPPEVLRRYDGLIAHHYHNAHQHQKELFYTLLAAEQTRKVYANRDAIRHYTRALDILTEMETETQDEARKYILCTQRFEVLNGRRQVLYTIGDLSNGRSDARALLPLADKLSDDLSWKIDALLAQPEVTHWDNRDELADGMAMAEDALTLAEQIGDLQRKMICLLEVAEKHRLLKQNDWLDMTQRALEIARSLNDRLQEVNILLIIGKAYGPEHRSDALQYLQQAFVASKKLEDSATQANVLQLLASELERQGDYYRQLTECEERRLEISRETGNRRSEGHALMKCGQIRALYLGDSEGGSKYIKEALESWQNISARIFPLLRLAQIRIQQRQLSEAQNILQEATQHQDSIAEDTGRAGVWLGQALLNLQSNKGKQALITAINEATQVWQMVTDEILSRQYKIAAGCILVAAHLSLSKLLKESLQKQEHCQKAQEISRAALEIYWEFGFVQVAECTSEEVLYRHSQALHANKHNEEASSFLQQAYTEMMRKHALIPPNSEFYQTYLNIPLHQEIQTAIDAERQTSLP